MFTVIIWQPLSRWQKHHPTMRRIQTQAAQASRLLTLQDSLSAAHMYGAELPWQTEQTVPVLFRVFMQTSDILFLEHVRRSWITDTLYPLMNFSLVTWLDMLMAARLDTLQSTQETAISFMPAITAQVLLRPACTMVEHLAGPHVLLINLISFFW